MEHSKWLPDVKNDKTKCYIRRKVPGALHRPGFEGRVPDARFDVPSESAIQILTASLASGWLVTRDLHPAYPIAHLEGEGRGGSEDNLPARCARSGR